jgi:hypothetical protein
MENTESTVLNQGCPKGVYNLIRFEGIQCIKRFVWRREEHKDARALYTAPSKERNRFVRRWRTEFGGEKLKDNCAYGEAN